LNTYECHLLLSLQLLFQEWTLSITLGASELTKKKKKEEKGYVLTPIGVTKLQTAHFTDRAPYWYISSILQFPQLTCAT
jgi:hypothetical protein